MGEKVSLIGKISPPPQMSIGGEHTKSWSIRVEKASYNAAWMAGKTVNLEDFPGIEAFAHTKARVEGIYKGIVGVTSKRPVIATSFIGHP